MGVGAGGGAVAHLKLGEDSLELGVGDLLLETGHIGQGIELAQAGAERGDLDVVLALRLFGAVVICFLLLPIAIAVVMAFSSGERLQFPPAGYSLRWFRAVLDSSLLMDGLRLSLIIAVASATATCAATSTRCSHRDAHAA